MGITIIHRNLIRIYLPNNIVSNNYKKINNNVKGVVNV
jgi:hypothetical protein